MVFRVVMRRLRNEDLAWDVVQDAFIKAMESIDKFQGRSAFSSWLIRIALNTATDKLRRSGREITGLDFALERAGTDSPLSELLSKEKLSDFAKHFEKLDAQEQLILELKAEEGMSSRQIAEVVGKSEGAVRVSIHRAREKLLKALENEDGEKNNRSKGKVA